MVTEANISKHQQALLPACIEEPFPVCNTYDKCPELYKLLGLPKNHHCLNTRHLSKRSPLSLRLEIVKAPLTHNIDVSQ